MMIVRKHFHWWMGLLAVGMAVGSTVWADESGFEQHKKEALAGIDSRIASLNEAKACIQGASSREGMKACHEKLKASHEAMREQRIDDRIERLKKRKEKLGSDSR